MVKRKAAIMMLSGVACTTLLGGSIAFANTASADTHRHRFPWHRHHRPPVTPSARPTMTRPPVPGPTSTAIPTLPPTSRPTAPPTGWPTVPPTSNPTTSPTADPDCTTAAGNAATIARPGIGTVTVTITVCDGTLKTVKSTQSQSNWDDNEAALPAMDKLSLEYATTDINMVNYSGATLTSQAYRTSLRSALDKAGL